MGVDLQHGLLFPKDFPLIPSQHARVKEMLTSRLLKVVIGRQLMLYALVTILIANPQCLAKVGLAPSVVSIGFVLVFFWVAVRRAPDGLSTTQRPYVLHYLLCHLFIDCYVMMVRWAELAEAVDMPARARFVRRLLPVGFTCSSGCILCATYYGPPLAFWVAVRCSLVFHGIFRASCFLFLRLIEAPAFYPPLFSFAGPMCFSLSCVLIGAAATLDRRRAFAKRFPLSMSIRLSELQGATAPRLDSYASSACESHSIPRKWFRRIESSASSATATEGSDVLPDHPSNGRSFIPWTARLPWRWARAHERQRKALVRKFPPSKAVLRPMSLSSSSWSTSDDSQYSTFSQQIREARGVGGLTEGRSCVPRKLKPT